MKFKRAVSAVALLGAAMVAAPASAYLLNTNTAAGSFNFDGFDWDGAGSAYTAGFAPTAGTNFTLTAFTWATAIQLGGVNIAQSSDLLDNIANGGLDAPNLYSVTLVANLNETVFGCLATTCTFDILAGSTFSIYLDDTAANDSTAGSLGTGFQNGVLIASGTVDTTTLGTGGTFTAIGATSGSGSASLDGVVTFTNPTYISPNLNGTTASTTLQLGTKQTSYTDPGGYNNTAWGAGLGMGANDIHVQADANQFFAPPVPEPGTLALLGIGLLGLFGIRMRRS